MTKKIAEGKPLYGSSPQPEHMQQVAAANSRHSQLWFAVLPWYVLFEYISDHLTIRCRFNLVNHPYHGDFAERYKKESKDVQE